MISIEYNYSGNVTTLHVQINDMWAEVPWDTTTKSVDWTQITYQPTLDSIQSAWNAWAEGKDLSIELRDRPDLAPPQAKQPPNWSTFN